MVPGSPLRGPRNDGIFIVPATLGLVLAGGLARRMGGGDKARIRIGGATILERVLGGSRRNAARSSSTPTAIRRVLPIPACLSSPTACRVLPVRSPAFWPGLDWAAAHAPDIEWLVSVPGDCPFLPKDLVSRLHDARIASGAAARLRPIRRTAAPGGRPVGGGAAPGFAARAGRRGHAQDRTVDRAAWHRHRRLAGGADRSIFQRQYAGGCGTRRRACPAQYPHA